MEMMGGYTLQSGMRICPWEYTYSTVLVLVVVWLGDEVMLESPGQTGEHHHTHALALAILR